MPPQDDRPSNPFPANDPQHLAWLIAQMDRQAMESRAQLQALEDQMRGQGRTPMNSYGKILAAAGLSLLAGLTISTLIGSLSFYRDFALVSERQHAVIKRLDALEVRHNIMEGRDAEQGFTLRDMERRILALENHVKRQEP